MTDENPRTAGYRAVRRITRAVAVGSACGAALIAGGLGLAARHDASSAPAVTTTPTTTTTTMSPPSLSSQPPVAQSGGS